MVKSRFPSAEMISEGEIKGGVISQNPDYTSRENGVPKTWDDRQSEHQTVGSGSVHGMEEVDWQSPMFNDLTHSKLPRKDHDKIGW